MVGKGWKMIWILLLFYIGNGCAINTPPHLSFDRDWILTEDEKVGSIVARVRVSDDDGDPVNVTLGLPTSTSFQKRPDSYAYFSIDANHRVKVARSLLGMAGETFLVGVIATDGQVRNRVDAKVTITKPNEVVHRIPSGLAAAFNPGPPPRMPDIGQFSAFDDVGNPPLLHLSPNTEWIVMDNATVGSVIRTVSADDMSETFLKFSLFPARGSFQIDQEDGTLVVARTLKGEIGNHKITVKVSNKWSSITEDVIIKVVPSDPSAVVVAVESTKTKMDDSEEHDKTRKEEEEKEEEEERRKWWKDDKGTRRNQDHRHRPTRRPIITIIEEVPGRETADQSTMGYIIILLVVIFGVLPLVLIGLFVCRRYRRRQKAKAEAKESSVSYTEKRLNHRGSIVNGLLHLIGLERTAENNGYDDSVNLPKVPSRDSSKSRKSTLQVTEKDDWEFSRHKLRILGKLGEGNFGQVWKYEATDLKSKGLSLVAVKTLKESAKEEDKNDFWQELKVLKGLGYHPNVVTLLGCCTDKEPIFVILEYMEGGKLQTLLRDSRADRSYDNLHGASGSLLPMDLIIFALQIAKGMDFLSKHGIIHRDLAARNVLLGEDKICKVADFGFARDVANNHVYERKSDGILPIRWMAPESLFDNIFTTKSDVWSFGILLWEIVTLGSTPYPGFAAKEVMYKVKDGYRLEKPEHCRREVYNIMYYCWDVDQVQRPDFKELVTTLETLISTEVDYIQLDNFPDRNYYNIKSEVDSTERL